MKSFFYHFNKYKKKIICIQYSTSHGKERTKITSHTRVNSIKETSSDSLSSSDQETETKTDNSSSTKTVLKDRNSVCRYKIPTGRILNKGEVC